MAGRGERHDVGNRSAGPAGDSGAGDSGSGTDDGRLRLLFDALVEREPSPERLLRMIQEPESLSRFELGEIRRQLVADPALADQVRVLRSILGRPMD